MFFVANKYARLCAACNRSCNKCSNANCVRNFFQMYNSLRQIRNSATKKQLNKIFDNGKSRDVDQQESVMASTSDDQEIAVKTARRQLVFKMFLRDCGCVKQYKPFRGK